MSPAEIRRLRNGGTIFLIAAVTLALLTGAPRVVSFGLALGAVLVIIAIWGVLLAIGALVPRKRKVDDELVPAPSEGDFEGSPYRSTPKRKQPEKRRWWSWRLWPDVIVVAAGAALFLPALGSHGLWDPWETHYGEVARRMLERDDWISMWWQNEWFYSKPVLIMWLDAIGMALVGSNPYPDGLLFGSAWGMRLPIAGLATFCMWGVYRFISRTFSVRAGLISALALATMPTFAFLSHQTMTDMPYVATMSLALCFLAIALETDDDRLISGTVVRLGRLGEI